MTWSSSRSRNGGRPTHVRRGVSCRSGWCTSGRRSPARLRPVRASRSGSRPRRRRLCSTRCSPERGKRREVGDFTTALVGQFEAAAAGGAAVASAVAAGETCAGLWGRGLALADVQPRNRRTAGLTPAYMELIGRQLARRGQSGIGYRGRRWSRSSDASGAGVDRERQRGPEDVALPTAGSRSAPPPAARARAPAAPAPPPRMTPPRAP